MIAKVTSPELAQDVSGAEALISRHMEHRAEINSREEAFVQFYGTGHTLIQQVNALLISVLSLTNAHRPLGSCDGLRHLSVYMQAEAHTQPNYPTAILILILFLGSLP